MVAMVKPDPVPRVAPGGSRVWHQKLILACCSSQLESQNNQYRAENERLRTQVDILRDRLHALPATSAREIHRLSLQVGQATSGLSSDVST